VFHIDVTFEMRTVHYGIRLLIDVHQIVGQHFISKGNGGEESKIVERQRESVCVRQCVVKRRESVSHKMSRSRNTSGRIKMGLIGEIPTLS
jgi:hypothetical protein